MNILFLDDSGQRTRQKFVCVGGVIFRDIYIKDVCTSFSETKRLQGIPADEEVKWHPDDNSWIAKNLKGQRRILVYSALLSLVQRFNGSINGSIIVVIVDREILGLNLMQAKEKCIKYATERFQLLLQDASDKTGIIIADFPGSGTEEKRLLRDYKRLYDEGTEYVRISNIVMNLLTTESCLNPMLQLADLVVGITAAMCYHKRTQVQPYWPLVKGRLHCSKSGRTIGCGLKIEPKQTAFELYPILLPEDYQEQSNDEYDDYIERMREAYSVIMSEEELDINFPLY